MKRWTWGDYIVAVVLLSYGLLCMGWGVYLGVNTFGRCHHEINLGSEVIPPPKITHGKLVPLDEEDPPPRKGRVR